MAEAFENACDALRAKLQAVESDEAGRASVEERASRDASAAGKASLGLGALRIVLQHVCQADQAVLSARPDLSSPSGGGRGRGRGGRGRGRGRGKGRGKGLEAPPADALEGCYAVTCEERDIFRSYRRDVYKPALTSKDCAWRLCKELAESIARERDGEVALDDSMVQYRGEPEYVVRVPEPGLGEIEDRFFISPTHYKLEGTIEGAETFLDLRSLAALRIVVGPAQAISKLFNTVVTLRETKTPRVLYAEHRNDRKEEESVSFRDLFVAKNPPTTCLVAARGEWYVACRSEGCQCRKYTPEVLKLAARIDPLWRQLPEPRPRIADPQARAAYRATPNLPSDATVAYAEDWGDDKRVIVAVRPLPLAAEADAVVKWGEGVETFRQQAKRELDAAASP
jgi:hypothetical protein